jgi:hypothetical protein
VRSGEDARERFVTPTAVRAGAAPLTDAGDVGRATCDGRHDGAVVDAFAVTDDHRTPPLPGTFAGVR